MLRFAAHHLPDVADADVKPASERDADSLANVLAFVFRISHLPLVAIFISISIAISISIHSSLPSACPVRGDSLPSKLLKLQSCERRQKVSLAWKQGVRTGSGTGTEQGTGTGT